MIKPIALLGEYTATFPPHTATNAAIEHSRNHLGMDISSTWVSTADIDRQLFDHYSGIWVAPGSPYKSMEKTHGPFAMPGKTKFPASAPAVGSSIW